MIFTIFVPFNFYFVCFSLVQSALFRGYFFHFTFIFIPQSSLPMALGSQVYVVRVAEMVVKAGPTTDSDRLEHRQCYIMK